MPNEYFVDWTKADDSGDGLSWPNAKKHISAAVGLLPTVLTDETII